MSCGGKCELRGKVSCGGKYELGGPGCPVAGGVSSGEPGCVVAGGMGEGGEMSCGGRYG